MARTLRTTEILSLLEKQHYRCALSGRQLTPETASLDHIQPLSRDGLHDISNVWIVDHQINAAKGSLTAEEFIRLCQEVTLNHNRDAERFLSKN